MRPKLGELLTQAGAIDQMQLRAALAEQRKWGGKLGAILVQMRMLTEEELVGALSRQLNIPRFKFTEGAVSETALQHIPVDTCERYNLLPVAVKADKRVILVAMSDPTNFQVVDELQFSTGYRVQVAAASQSEVYDAIRRYYYGEQPVGTTPDPEQMQALAKYGDFSDEPMFGSSGAPVRPHGIDPAVVDPVSEPAAPAPQVVTGQPEAIDLEPHQPFTEPAAPAAPADSGDFAKLEDKLKRVMAAQRELINLMIEKGVFSKAEFMARLKRSK